VIQQIRVAQLLRETVSTPYSDLVTRPTGRAVRGRIEQAMAQAEALTMHLDFSEIGLLDFSCADEVVAKLLLVTVANPDCCIVLRGVSEAQLEAIDHVLQGQQLTVTALVHETVQPRLLGWRTPDAARVFDALHSSGGVEAVALAGALGWPFDRAMNALEDLVVRRLVRCRDGRYSSVALA
jgi:hypothetical protein